MKKPQNELRCTFVSNSCNEALARGIATSFLIMLDPTAEELADVRCSVSEAVTNSIVHAYRGTSGEVAMILRSYDDGTVKITVSDRGCGIGDVEQARAPLFTTAPDEDRCGMGFSIMESLSDKLTVKSALGKGTKVTITKKLSSKKSSPT